VTATKTDTVGVLNVTNTLPNPVEVEVNMNGILWANFTLDPGGICVHEQFFSIGRIEVKYRIVGTHKWILTSGSSDVRATFITTDGKLNIGEPTPLRITNIEFNEEHDDYDVTCTHCGMCYIATTESEAQNKLFSHLRTCKGQSNE